MEQQRVRKTYQHKLKPTLEHDQVLERVLGRCRTLYNIALDERTTVWERCNVSVTYCQQKAALPDLKRECPEFAEVHSPVLQDVLLRLAPTFQAFFHRLKNGEQSGYPRFQGRNHDHPFTYPQCGEHGGAVLDVGVLSLSKIGRIPDRVHRPLQGTPKTVTIAREADGRYACFSCAEVPIEALPCTGGKTGIDVGLSVFLVTADGDVVENPCHYRNAEQGLQKANRGVARRKRGSNRRRKAVQLLKRADQNVWRQRRDFHHKTALILLKTYETYW
jgi:putative transposase